MTAPTRTPWTDTYGPHAAHLSAPDLTAEQYARVTRTLRAYHAQQPDAPVPSRAAAALLLRLILTLPPSRLTHAGHDQPARWLLTSLLRFLHDPHGAAAPHGTLDLDVAGWTCVHPGDLDEQRRLHALIGTPPGGTYQYRAGPSGAAQLTVRSARGRAVADLHVHQDPAEPLPGQLERAVHSALSSLHPHASEICVQVHVTTLPTAARLRARTFADLLH